MLKYLWPGLLALETDEAGSSKGEVPHQATVKRPLGRLRLKRSSTIAKPLRGGLNFMKSNKTGECTLSLCTRTTRRYGTRLYQQVCVFFPALYREMVQYGVVLAGVCVFSSTTL